MHGFPTGCATSCTFGKRSFTGSFNARACDWQGIRKSSAFWKQERQEGCFQARFLMSSSSLRIPREDDDQDVPRTQEGSWERSRNRPEPTGFEPSVTNFLSLPGPVRHTVSKGATSAC